jgi:hypothetical protein
MTVVSLEERYVEADGRLTFEGFKLFSGAASGGGGTVAWGDITGVPATFAPSAHTHPQSDITGLTAALAAKQATLVSGTTIKTINGATVLGAGDLVVTGANTFETVAKNLSAVDATLGYSGGELTTVVYAGGITKTLAYSGGNLVTVTLSGSTPGGIDLVKTLSYTGADLTGVAYS